MQELSKEFIGTGEVRGFKFKQIHKCNQMYMYEVQSLNDDGGYSEPYYEVFERKVSKASEGIIGGVRVEFKEHEVYPRSNSFGVFAWCVSDYDRALKLFKAKTKDVIERMNKKEKNLAKNFEVSN